MCICLLLSRFFVVGQSTEAGCHVVLEKIEYWGLEATVEGIISRIRYQHCAGRLRVVLILPSSDSFGMRGMINVRASKASEARLLRPEESTSDLQS